MDDVKAFYKKYYNPNNAILSVAGDVTVEQIKALSQKWFGEIEKGEEVLHQYPEEPKQTKAKEEVVVELLETAVPIPITLKLDSITVNRREDEEE